MITLIDNYDSFTYNLYHYLSSREKVVIIKNDQVSKNFNTIIKSKGIVISPGPGNPKNAGISIKVIESFYQTIPILGVCLGHQCLVEFFGGKIIRAEKLMHGKTSQIEHDNQTIFRNMPIPFTAGRYHSLSADKNSMPRQLLVSAKTNEGEIMGVRHESFPIEGVQFHPESILTPEGPKLLRNFLRYVK